MKLCQTREAGGVVAFKGRLTFGGNVCGGGRWVRGYSVMLNQPESKSD